MSGHTPGPWTIQPEPNGDGSGQEWDEYAVYSTGRSICSGILTIADAHVVAAGPDLLAALKGLTDVGNDVTGESFDERVKRALTAIAKAEGRS